MGYPNNRSAGQGWDIPKQLNEIRKLGYPKNGRRREIMGYPNPLDSWDIPKWSMMRWFEETMKKRKNQGNVFEIRSPP